MMELFSLSEAPKGVKHSFFFSGTQWETDPGVAFVQNEESKDTPTDTFAQEYRTEKNTLRRISCPATLLIVLVNILVFLRTDLATLMGWENTWIQKGSLNWQNIFYDHQYYRLITYMFLHVNGEHIFNNMISLVFLGDCLEKKLGTSRFTVLYFSSGILAGCTSLAYHMIKNNQSSSVGASGAVCGALGALIVMAVGHHLLRDVNRTYLFAAVLLVLYSSFTVQGADNAAHIGGCIAGAFITLLLTLHMSLSETET